MVKIITFEGLDYSGKTSTLLYLSKKHGKNPSLAFNEGPVYQNNLTSRLLTIATQCTDQEREFLYTMSFVSDSVEANLNKSGDPRLIFQDRYWPSVLAYGRFLNGSRSIHRSQDFRPLWIPPVEVVYFSCSNEERLRRSIARGRKSVIDTVLLSDPHKIELLSGEIDRSLEGLPNIFKIDTTGKSIQQVAEAIELHLAPRYRELTNF